MTMAIPEPRWLLPESESDLVAYGQNCLRIGKIANEQFGKACQALLDGPGSWTQRRVAEAMGCDKDTVAAALSEAGIPRRAYTRSLKAEPSALDDLEESQPLEGKIVPRPEPCEPGDYSPPTSRHEDLPPFDPEAPGPAHTWTMPVEQLVEQNMGTFERMLRSTASLDLSPSRRQEIRTAIHAMVDRELP